MRQFVTMAIWTMALAACAGGQPVPSPPVGTASETAETEPDTTPAAAPGVAAPGDSGEAEGAPGKTAGEFVLRKSDTAAAAQGVKPSTLRPTATEAVLKFSVIDKDKGPVQGIVISLAAPDGKKYYTEETDSQGYAEVLLPVGQKYDLVYLSLGRRDVAASVSVSNEPHQNIKLTLRYKGVPPLPASDPAAPRFVLDGIQFDTGKATIRPESFPRLDSVAEYMLHKKGTRIEISGHTDNVGNKKANQVLSEKRAQACRKYLISKGVEGNRIEAIGYGDQRPVTSNDTDEGRQRNRRIEARDL